MDKRHLQLNHKGQIESVWLRGWAQHALRCQAGLAQHNVEEIFHL